MHSFLSLGRLHIPVYGLVAAIGLICAMVLSQRSARLARIDPDALWNLGMITILSAFAISRAILVLENLPVFLRDPLLVLELPSVTREGMALTAIISFVYLRRKNLPLLSVLDAVAPCAALLWAFFNLGSLAEGTREGMTTSFPLAITSAFGRVHPVEAYSAIAWLLLCAILLGILRRTRNSGETAAIGLILGGLLLYLLDFLRLPAELYSSTRLDGIQPRALALIVAGTLLLAWRLARIPHPAPEADGPHHAV